MRGRIAGGVDAEDDHADPRGVPRRARDNMGGARQRLGGRAMTQTTPDQAYFGVPEIAASLGWTWKRTKGWLSREGVLIRKADRWVTTPDKLRAAFPEVWARICEEREERAMLGEGDEDA